MLAEQHVHQRSKIQRRKQTQKTKFTVGHRRRMLGAGMVEMGGVTVTAHCNGSAYKLSAHARDTEKEMAQKNGLDKAEKEKKK